MKCVYVYMYSFIVVLQNLLCYCLLKTSSTRWKRLYQYQTDYSKSNDKQALSNLFRCKDNKAMNTGIEVKHFFSTPWDQPSAARLIQQQGAQFQYRQYFGYNGKSSNYLTFSAASQVFNVVTRFWLLVIRKYLDGFHLTLPFLEKLPVGLISDSA